jgi:hypothetical protein
MMRCLLPEMEPEHTHFPILPFNDTMLRKDLSRVGGQDAETHRKADLRKSEKQHHVDNFTCLGLLSVSLNKMCITPG